MTRPDDFRRILRRGRSAGRRRLVVHAIVGSDDTATDASRVGLVVGRTVGPSVVRHRVSRRLRHLLAARLDVFPPGTELVVRAQAAAASASSEELAADLDRALTRLGLRIQTDGATGTDYATWPHDSRGLNR